MPTDLAIEFRPARRDDLDSIVALLAQDSMLPDQPTTATPGHVEAFEEISRHGDTELVVATIEGQVVATLQLNFLPGLGYDGAWRAQIEAVRVRADLRNKRIGARLIQHAIDRARERKCRLIQLTSNKARVEARRFYERLGFTASHIGMKLLL